MAARFWRLLLAWQLLCAAVVTALLTAALSLSSMGMILTALVACALAPCALVASSFVVSRTTARGDPAHLTGGPDLWRALIGESVAFVAAMFSMIAEPYRRKPMDLPPGRLPARPVLLIHGIVCNRAVWRPFVKQLRAKGFAPVRAINLEPLTAEIDLHAASVVRELRELQQQSNGSPVAIVAHSMGGLVARVALRSVGPEVVNRIVTIASPHHGTTIARLFRSAPAPQMSPESPWLRALNANQEGHLDVPVTCIYSLEDNLIAPPRSAMLQGARLHELRGLGHLSLLRARQAIDCAMAAL